MPRQSTSDSDPSEHPRLQKVLASAGYGSRRQCEQLILDGRVEIDRQIVEQLGTRVDPQRQQIRVDGSIVRLPRHKWIVLHKPVGVISTAKDPWARTRVIDLIDDDHRLFTVGRLDKSSSGLILVTNDGDLAQRLTHPKYRVPKVYRVVVAGRPSAEAIRQLRRGIHLAEGKARVERVTIKKSRPRQSVLEIVLTEGRNREIRRLLARVGHKVQQLQRIAIGPIRLGELPVGAYRELTRQEVDQLRRASRRPRPSAQKHRGGRSNRSESATHDQADAVGRRRKSPAGTVIGASERVKPGRRNASKRRSSEAPRGGDRSRRPRTRS